MTKVSGDLGHPRQKIHNVLSFLERVEERLLVFDYKQPRSRSISSTPCYCLTRGALFSPKSYPPNCVVYTDTHDNDTTCTDVGIEASAMKVLRSR